MENLRVGINGFGRIGKIVYQVFVKRNIRVAVINDPFAKPEDIEYALKYDTTFGRSGVEIHRSGNKITAGNVESKILSERSPANINWDNVDVVIEASGVFLTLSDCDGHLKTAKRVIITAPSPNASMYVYGVNHSEYMGEKIISNASCTTNCLAAIAKVVHENFGIEEGLMTTVHATTNSQCVVDTCAAKRSKRSCFNIIPASTGAAKALSKVIPALEGKMTGMAFRVPVLNVSVVDMNVRLKRSTTLEKILEKVKDVAKGEMKGVLCYTEDEVVSGDYNGCGLSCIFDYKASIALNDKFFKLVCWYDNEYGYSCRVVDMALYIHDK